MFNQKKAFLVFKPAVAYKTTGVCIQSLNLVPNVLGLAKSRYGLA